MKLQNNDLGRTFHPDQQSDEECRTASNDNDGNTEVLLSERVIDQNSSNSGESDNEKNELDNLVQMSRHVAHELNNLLTTILANAQLASLMIDNEEAKYHLSVVEEATDDAGRMVHRFQESIHKLAKKPA